MGLRCLLPADLPGLGREPSRCSGAVVKGVLGMEHATAEQEWFIRSRARVQSFCCLALI